MGYPCRSIRTNFAAPLFSIFGGLDLILTLEALYAYWTHRITCSEFIQFACLFIAISFLLFFFWGGKLISGYQRLLQTGEVAPGKILGIQSRARFYSLTFEYHYNGTTYHYKTPNLLYFAWKRRLTIGQSVTVYLDVNHPGEGVPYEAIATLLQV